MPDILEIEIRAGANVEELSRILEEAQLKLDSLCQSVGASSVEEARETAQTRDEAERLLKTAKQAEKEILGGLTLQQIEADIARLEPKIAGYVSTRVENPPICPDPETARAELEKASLALKQADTECRKARELASSAEQKYRKIREEHQNIQIRLELLNKDLAEKKTALEKDRKNISDNDLEIKLAEAKQIKIDIEAEVISKEAVLRSKNPHQAYEAAREAEEKLARNKKKLDAMQTELTQITTRLETLGESGLHEKLNTSRKELEFAVKEKLVEERKAQAVKLLFETMREEREKARQSYARPLKDKIDQLGSIIFGESFSVCLNENLQIVERTLDNISIPYESLSGGTREQLSLIFRLACSIIVAKEGGAPLIMDDTLGYTDPRRLLLMGEVLSQAADECQVVIFTCVPERYRNISKATVVCLE